MRISSIGFLLFCASLVLACGADETTPQPVIRPIKIIELGGGAGSQFLEFPGTVNAGLRAELAFEVAGKITEFFVTEGQNVSKGEALATLDARDFQSKLDAERAKSKAAQAEYDRTLKLFEENVTSKQQLETKKRNFEVTETGVERAQKALDDATLVAPFDGVVARVEVENFENVQAKQPVLIVENASVFEVVADIPEQDAARLTPGVSLEERTERSKPQVGISALDGRRFDARITEFASTADPKTRTFALTLAFDNPGDVSLASGMTATVRFHVPDELVGDTGILVPSAAVSSSADGDPIVWVIDPETMAASSRSISVGAMSGDRIRVTEGLRGNEWIAESGVQFLHDGLVVSRMAE